ncbi:sulfatase-like hydrolase/transferase [Rubellicoccus peritrichatus]|uniref:Sulfatase-like hydrolase/transferase n=1 Tax=Rubellicoccus peritrichatus TaxID=3080537 RepID=A0AAQ3L8L4_9BACT|nr:sulfatase-like hydrolase/transferase [Puniceicoccus sp. CR14]WOO40856.1 sulfatase-like hydrolase/transferase [Puniceicoccus sp. CR14]
MDRHIPFFIAVLTAFLQITNITRAADNSQSDSKRPNIIFIITDDQNTNELGYLGGNSLTPNIDSLANGGINFTRSYVSSSVCSPSRYTCLTGQYASRCTLPYFTDQASSEGVTRVLWNIGFSPDQINLPQALQGGGYKTGFVGKWHINGLPGWKTIAKGTDVNDPIVKETLESNQRNFSKGVKTHGFDFAKNIYAGNPDDDQGLKNVGLNKHNQEWLTQAGLEFIEEYKDEPFFLYFSTTLTHVPDTHESLTGDPRRSPVGMLDEPITGVQPSRESVIERCKAAGIPKKNWGATWLDDGVGALMKKLDDLGIAENTLIVYFVDHGMVSTSKGTCYVGGLIAPTVAYWPAKVKPQVCDKMIQNIDFAPTFLQVAGITPPVGMKIDGNSFAPLLWGEPFEGHTSVYSEIGLTRAVTTKDWQYIAFRVPESMQRTVDERMKDHLRLIEDMKKKNQWYEKWTVDPEARYYQMGMGAGGLSFERWQYNNGGAWKPHYFDADQLYDLKTDPLQSTNLAGDPKYAAKLAEMQKLLKTYLNDLPGTYPGLKPNIN